MYLHYLKIVGASCFLLQVCILKGQVCKNMVVHLEKQKNPPKIHMAFSKVSVLDNRPERGSLIGVTFGGNFSSCLYQFDTSASTAVEFYINRAITIKPDCDSTLFLNLRRFQISQNFRTHSTAKGRKMLFFSIDAYLKLGDRYLKMMSFDTIYKHATNGIIAGEALNDFIKAFGRNGFGGIGYTGAATSFQGIERNNVFSEWKKYSVINKSGDSKGFYRFFNDVRNDKMSTYSHLSMRLNRDSVYTFRNKWGATVASIQIDPQKDSIYIITTDSSESIRAKRKLRRENKAFVYDQGKWYIRLFNNFYLPAEVRNNTFYFHIGEQFDKVFNITLMNNKAVLFAGSMPVGGAPDENSVFKPDNLSGSPVAIVVGIIGFGLINELISHIKARQNEFSVSEEYYPFGSNSFIDMDTGNIIYY